MLPAHEDPHTKYQGGWSPSGYVGQGAPFENEGDGIPGGLPESPPSEKCHSGGGGDFTLVPLFQRWCAAQFRGISLTIRKAGGSPRCCPRIPVVRPVID
jgi:hypothetical protein